MGINDLDSVVNEMDVQDRYRVAFRKVFKDIIFESKYRTDGLAYSMKNKLRMILEQKHDYDFNSLVERAKVVAQVIRYIKTIHDEDPTVMPKVAVIGDENECFVLPVKDIINYISVKEYQWSLSPSSMHQDKVLLNDLIEDDIVKHLYIYKPQNEFKEIIDKIRQINKGINVPRTLTEKNIDRVYKYFTDKIILKRGGKKISPNDSVNLFAHIMLHPNSVMLNHKTKQLFTGMFKEPLTVSNIEAYLSFITEFSRTYTPKQKHIFTAILDRLIEDTTRRNQGEFFTPYLWANEAHKYIASVYGEDWKEKYVVWDPAWGTGNLTRDYKFKELYASTLNQSDIDTANQMSYNSDSTKFQYDFLNDDYDFLPKKLRDAIESGRKIIVLMNPPYATGASSMKKGKKGTGKTKINDEMSKNRLGKAAGQLYAQFIYRLKKFNNVSLAMFTKPTFMTGDGYSNFRTDVMSKWNYRKGFVMNAKDFEGVKKWPLTFTIWDSNLENKEISNTYSMDILELENFNIEQKGVKNFYNLDNQVRLNDYVKKLSLKIKKKTYPNLSSALVVSNAELGFSEDFLGYMNVNGNTIQYNNQLVGLYSAPFAGGSNGVGHSPGFCLDKQNFSKSMMMFAARNTIKSDWLTEKDEYMVPNFENTIYEQFEKDSLIISLFNNSSQQSSLRQVIYKESTYDIKNEFFWMSKDEIMDIANQNDYTELYNDARTDSDRYVYNLLFGEQRIYDQLSDEAKDVLDSATNLVRLSFEMRKNFANETNHLNSWDAGYAQLKLLWKEYYSEQFKEFRDKYKVLEDKMRPMVYELGFLLK